MGHFGFSLKGRNIQMGEYAIVGRFEADGQGQVRGHAFQSLGGDFGQVEISGSYSVASDCTGTTTLTFHDTNNTDKLNFVLVADGQEIFIIDAGGNTVETGVAKKQFVRGQPKLAASANKKQDRMASSLAAKDSAPTLDKTVH
jgi:hypothetical protein